MKGGKHVDADPRVADRDRPRDTNRKVVEQELRTIKRPRKPNEERDDRKHS